MSRAGWMAYSVAAFLGGMAGRRIGDTAAAQATPAVIGARAARTSARHPAYWVLDQSVWAVLDQDWNDTSVTQPERGYCVAYAVDWTFGAPTYHVWAIARAPTTHATPDRIHFECPSGPGFARLHTHPVSTDQGDGQRVRGGVEAHECFPSAIDRMGLAALRESVGFIQCDRRAVVAFGPDW